MASFAFRLPSILFRWKDDKLINELLNNISKQTNQFKMGNTGSVASEKLPASMVEGVKAIRPDFNELNENQLIAAVSNELVAAKFGHKIVPGSTPLDLSFPSPNGGSVRIHAENNRHKLVIFYRGAFCPICLVITIL